MPYETDNERKRGFFDEAFEWIEVFIVAMSVVMLLFTFVFRIANVSGESMLDTLHDGDKLFIFKAFYTPHYGDVVVLARPHDQTEPYVKRVIGTSGQEVNINFQSGEVFIDGALLGETYILEDTRNAGDIVFPVTVPPGHVFVMGDNRNNSLDSRFSSVGMIDERYLLGKAVFKLFPFNRMGKI